MEPNTSGFKPLDICAIMEAGNLHNVSKISYNGLEIIFKQEDPPRLGKVGEGYVNQLVDGETSASQESVHEDELEKPPLILTDEEKEVMEELRLAQLMNDDPLAYEQEMIDVNLNEEGGKNEREES